MPRANNGPLRLANVISFFELFVSVSVKVMSSLVMYRSLSETRVAVMASVANECDPLITAIKDRQRHVLLNV